MNKINSRGTVTISLDEYEKLKSNEEKLKKNTVCLYRHSRTNYSNTVSVFEQENLLLCVNMDKKGKEQVEGEFRKLYHEIHDLKIKIKGRDEKINWLKSKLKEEESKNEILVKEKLGEPILTEFGVVYPKKKSFLCRLFNC